MKKVVITFLLFIGLVGVYAVWQNFQQQQKVAMIDSFEACAEMFPVMTSYPARCVTSDGRSFTQVIGNELEYLDEVRVANPRPNQMVSSPLEITGQARGMWFFEGQFSAELFDANNASLGTAILTAEGEWMTEEFVPFSGTVIFEMPVTEKGVLKIRNANPSGLPENQKELMIPVQFSS